MRAVVFASVVFSGVRAQSQPPPRPSPAQRDFLSGHGLSQFMHFGPCTFAGCQWDRAVVNASTFAPPDDMDTDQWMEAALAWGADEVCLTVRHVDGFCLWPSASTNYTVAASPWRGGHGDVVRDFVTSARKFGVRPCFYIILGFNFYANYSNVPPALYLQQQKLALTELLTNYGPIDRLWWDNYGLDGRIYQPVTHEGFVCPGNIQGPACPAWAELIDLVRSLSPTTVMVPGPDGCLVNGESSGGTYPLYLASPEGSYWCTNSGAALINASTFMLAESDYTIENPGDNWFWNANLPIIDSSDMWSQVTLKWGQGANLIFNVPPNSSGMVPEADVAVLRQFGAERTRTYGTAIAAMDGSATAECALLSVVVDVPPTAMFDQIVVSEDLTAGQGIASYTIEALTAQPAVWTKLPVHGVTVGRRVVDYGLGNLTGITALRFNCTSTLPFFVGPVTLSSFAAYFGG